RAVGLEHALDAFAVRDLAHRKGRIEAAVALSDHDAGKGLQALALPFLDLDLDLDGVAGTERRDLAIHLFGLYLPDDVVHLNSPASVPSIVVSSLRRRPRSCQPARPDSHREADRAA